MDRTHQARRWGLLVALLLAGTLCVSPGASGQTAPGGQAAGGEGEPAAIVPVDLVEGIAQAQSTATPLFVMLTRATCGNCNHLKGRLTADEGLRDVLAGYVVVDMDVDSPLAAQWQARFPSPGNTLPLIYVVAATGQGIKSASGPQRGEALPAMLKEGLTAAEQIHQAAGLVRKENRGQPRSAPPRSPRTRTQRTKTRRTTRRKPTTPSR